MNCNQIIRKAHQRGAALLFSRCALNEVRDPMGGSGESRGDHDRTLPKGGGHEQRSEGVT